MRRNRALYLAILLLITLTAGSAEAETPSEWDDGSVTLEAPTPFGPSEAADLKDELDRQLRWVRTRRARIDAGETDFGSSVRLGLRSRELLEHEARLLVASAGIAEVADGAVRDPAEIAVRVGQALAAFEAALATEGGSPA